LLRLLAQTHNYPSEQERMLVQSLLRGEEDPLGSTEPANVNATIPNTPKSHYIILQLKSSLQPPKLKSVVSYT